MRLSREEALADLERSSLHVRANRLPVFRRNQIEPSCSQREGLTAREQHLWTTQCVELIRTAGMQLRK